jgi:hypothetical protein
MRDLIEKSLLLEKKVKALLEKGEQQASLQLTNEITEILSTTLLSLQQEKQKETVKFIQSFINERLNLIKKDETSIELKEGAKVVVHLIQLNTFEQDENYLDISFLKEKAYMLPQLTQSGYNDRFNYDGYLTYYLSSSHTSYVQVFRNGCMEIVDNGVFSTSEKWIFATKFETAIIEQLPKYLNVLKQRNFNAPYFVQITFLNVKDYTIYLQNRFFFDTYKIEKDELHLQNVLIENIDEHLAKTLKPAFDVLWNSGGYPDSINYNNGNWRPRN